VGHLTPLRADLLDGAVSRRIHADLAARYPDPLLVVMGKPLQEWWMGEYAQQNGAQVVVAFGAAIDFIADTMPKAAMDEGPRFGMELWILREPRRSSHRYLVQEPVALAKLHSDRQIVASAQQLSALLESQPVSALPISRASTPAPATPARRMAP